MSGLENKKVLIVGFARSGIAAANYLIQYNNSVAIYDAKSKEQLQDQLGSVDPKVELKLALDPVTLLEDIQYIILSPGVPTDLPFLNAAREKGIQIIGEFELASRYCKAPIVAITGTNGKTTTTSLVGEIFKRTENTTFVVGNIGIPFISKVDEIQPEDVVVAEVSSFQLESIKEFHPKVSAILNFTPDHLNRHYTFENYVAAKKRIFENQQPEDYCILNKDDKECVKLASEVRCKIVWFCRTEILEEGVFVQNEKIIIKNRNEQVLVCDINEIGIPGNHNIENALAAVAMAYVMGVDVKIIAEVLKEFRGVEHRIEFVDEIEGVIFYNDSKATNPDAAIKAVEAMKQPFILIAGGMDKGNDFTELLEIAKNKMKGLVVLGETAETFVKTAAKVGIETVIKVGTVQEAVNQAFNQAERGEVVLLSPACASWDMFSSFEERGQVFKDAVKGLRG